MVEEFMRQPLSFAVILAVSLLGCTKGGPKPAAGMTESFVSKNGLITAHFPADFAASSVGESSIVVSRNLPGGQDEALAFLPIEKPISSDLQEFARVIGAAEVKNLHGYVESSSLPATCAGKPGIETTGTGRAEKGTSTYLRKACHFLANGHGYSITYSVPSTLAAEEEPTLRAIREATQFNR
jgi:hypothetical protein